MKSLVSIFFLLFKFDFLLIANVQIKNSTKVTSDSYKEMSVKVITTEKRVIITDGDSEFLDSK